MDYLTKAIFIFWMETKMLSRSPVYQINSRNSVLFNAKALKRINSKKRKIVIKEFLDTYRSKWGAFTALSFTRNKENTGILILESLNQLQIDGTSLFLDIELHSMKSLSFIKRYLSHELSFKEIALNLYHSQKYHQRQIKEIAELLPHFKSKYKFHDRHRLRVRSMDNSSSLYISMETGSVVSSINENVPFYFKYLGRSSLLWNLNNRHMRLNNLKYLSTSSRYNKVNLTLTVEANKEVVEIMKVIKPFIFKSKEEMPVMFNVILPFVTENVNLDAMSIVEEWIGNASIAYPLIIENFFNYFNLVLCRRLLGMNTSPFRRLLRGNNFEDINKKGFQVFYNKNRYLF